jgi:predicted 3-demethylubiquinone-9 3-methyltransferase (glyoxalase superfamily)
MTESQGRDMTMQGLTTCLWFDTQAEEAANYYTSVFDDGKITQVTRYGSAGPRPDGSVMTVDFQLAGQDFVALNGGPEFTFNEAISIQINCDSQDEVDRYWARLSEGGEEGPCGWLKDKYGVSWQVIPTLLNRLITDPDQEKAQRAMAAMLQMGKIDSAKLQAAFDGD